jgi:hypothetical protein
VRKLHASIEALKIAELEKLDFPKPAKIFFSIREKKKNQLGICRRAERLLTRHQKACNPVSVAW